jgi:carboxyl-terminal processing protease
MTRWLPFLVVTLCIQLAPCWGLANDDPLQPDEPDDYELHKLLVDTINQVEQNYVKPIDRRRLVEAAIRGVLRELDDYSDYVAPERMGGFRTAVSHQFAGIGIKVGMRRNQLAVISPFVGSPAYRAGLIAGDRILEIDGKPTKGLRLDDAVKLLKGKTGSSVALKVSHPGRTEIKEVTLTREVIRLETVLADLRGDDGLWDYLLDDESRIGYIRITGFGRNTAEDLRKALNILKKDDMAGLILDLRFNPGGLLSSAIQVADLFVSEGKIVSTAGRNVKEHVWEAEKEGTYESVPLVVLVNRSSASASEIVAACLQDHQRAVVIGERTYGKGSVQRVIEMEGGQSALKLTTAGYCRPNGKNIDRHPDDTLADEWGVKPNDGFALPLNSADSVALELHRQDRDALKSLDKRPSNDDPASRLEEAEFADQQLAMALNHLRKQLAAQAGESSPDASPAEAAELAKAPEESESSPEAAKVEPANPESNETAD